MKNYALAAMILLYSNFTVLAAFINGFSQEKLILENEIRKTVELLNNQITEKADKQIEKQLRRLRKEYEIVSARYAQTDALLSTFEQIDPELFAKFSKVTNADGTLAHVYVNRLSEEFILYQKSFSCQSTYGCEAVVKQ